MTEQFAKVPAWLYRSTASAVTIRVYGEMQLASDFKTHRCEPSHSDLAEKVHKSVATVKRSIDHLEQLGAVTRRARRVGQRQASNEYVVHESQQLTHEPLTDVSAAQNDIPEQLTHELLKTRGTTDQKPKQLELDLRPAMTAAEAAAALRNDPVAIEAYQRAMAALLLVATLFVERKERRGETVTNPPGLARHLCKDELAHLFHPAREAATSHPEWSYERIADKVYPEWRALEAELHTLPDPAEPADPVEAFTARALASSQTLNERLQGLPVVEREDYIVVQVRKMAEVARVQGLKGIDEELVVDLVLDSIRQARHLTVVTPADTLADEA